jgi:hypothetical protein
VSKDEGLALARTFGCSFMEASAKTAHNVELLFTNLIRALRSTGEMVTGGELSPQQSLKEKTHKKCCIFWRTDCLCSYDWLSAHVMTRIRSLVQFEHQPLHVCLCQLNKYLNLIAIQSHLFSPEPQFPILRYQDLSYIMGGVGYRVPLSPKSITLQNGWSRVAHLMDEVSKNHGRLQRKSMWDSLVREDDGWYLSTEARLTAYLSIASVIAAETSPILVISVVCVRL